MWRWIGWIVLCMLVACGDSPPTLSEYAGEVDRLLGEMNQGLEDLESQQPTSGRTLADVQHYQEARITIREDFVGAFERLAPPAEAEELHEAALSVVTRLLEAEVAIAARTAAASSLSDLAGLAESAEVAEFLAVDEEAQALCRSAQERFDATRERAEMAGVPWVPPEMKEVVRVALRCTADE